MKRSRRLQYNYLCQMKFLGCVDGSEYRFIIEGSICTYIIRSGGYVQGFATFS
jgi:hypothetical protein